MTKGPEPSKGEVATAMRLARHHGISRLVLLGNVTTAGPDPTMQDVRVINTHTLRAMDLCPDLFLGFCYLNPAHPISFIEEEIERCVTQGGMKGLKLWIAVRATDTRLDPIMLRAQALGLPVLHHAWFTQTSYTHQESNPAEVADLARRWPGVTVVMAHLGGAGPRGILEVSDTANVLVDTSGSQPEAGLVEYAVRRLGAHRVLYGSDWPIRGFGAQLGRITGAALTAEEKSCILGGNAMSILRLEGHHNELVR